MGPPPDIVFENEITKEELQVALRKLKNGKTGADDGLVAEMLKTGHDGLVALIADFFTQILQGTLLPPDEWKVTKLRVLFKKGDPTLPKNYRPIAVLSVMAKLFSTVLSIQHSRSGHREQIIPGTIRISTSSGLCGRIAYCPVGG